MGRPRKAPHDVLEPVGSRIPQSLLLKIQDAMKELKQDGRINRETVSAAVGWLIDRGVKGMEQDRDSQLAQLLQLWPKLTDIEHEMLDNIAAMLIKQHEVNASADEGLQSSEGKAGPALLDRKPDKGDGQRGKEKEDEVESDPGPRRAA